MCGTYLSKKKKKCVRDIKNMEHENLFSFFPRFLMKTSLHLNVVDIKMQHSAK